MNFHLRMNQVEMKCTTSACQMMAPELQVENKELGCECERHIFKKIIFKKN
jgi:hypothetical protein